MTTAKGGEPSLPPARTSIQIRVVTTAMVSVGSTPAAIRRPCLTLDFLCNRKLTALSWITRIRPDLDEANAQRLPLPPPEVVRNDGGAVPVRDYEGDQTAPDSEAHDDAEYRGQGHGDRVDA